MPQTPQPLILYVDDSEPNRLVFEQTFMDGFNVRTADSAAQALRDLDELEVAVLITDQRMPEMSGNELLIRARDAHPEVVRMVVTAYGDLDPILRAVNDGLVARYMVKPWDRRQLEQMLRWGIETYRLGGQQSQTQVRLLELERLATLGAIQASMVHDIKQPLSYMKGNAEVIREKAKLGPALRTFVEQKGGDLSTADRESFLWLADELGPLSEDFLQGCGLVADIVNGVRRLVSPSTQARRGDTTEPGPGIRFALATCRRLFLGAAAATAFDDPGDVPRLALGGTELAQVLINLLTNAAHAMTRRTKAGGKVQFKLRDLGSSIEFMVIDDGPGMEPDVLQRAGTPFFTTRKDGVGLGLNQCRRLVEGAGGTFAIKSAQGAGTTIAFTVKKVE